MNSKLLFLVTNLVGSALVLSACSKKDDNKVNASPEIPNALSFSKPAPGVKLTLQQAAQIKKAFASKPSMILPPGELIFTPKDMTPELKAQKEQELKEKDQNSYELLKMVQTDCVKDRPTSHIEATFPIDGDDAKRNLRAGDYASMSGAAGLAGAKCPVDTVATTGMGARIEERNIDADSGKASVNLTQSLKAVMKNARFAELLGARGMIVQSSISALMVSREVSKEKPSGRAMIQMNLGGSYLSLTQDIPFSASYQALINEKGGNEVVVSAHIQMKDFAFDLDVHGSQLSENRPPVSEAYLNGYPVTQKDLDDLFGKNSPSEVGAQTAAFLK
jgi:hypothetical protein